LSSVKWNFTGRTAAGGYLADVTGQSAGGGQRERCGDQPADADVRLTMLFHGCLL